MMKPVLLCSLWLFSFPTLIDSAFTKGTNNTISNLPSNGSALYAPLFEKHSNSTPKFINATGQTANPLVKALKAKNGDNEKRSLFGAGILHGGTHHGHKAHHLHKRADPLPEGTCAPGTPCVNGACCSKTGICGYSPNECGSGNCISNCKATAPCGQYAKPEDKNCPLNVCCSYFGFCGSTSEFCATSGQRQCQKGFGTCGDAPRPSCGGGDSSSKRVIGYYEGWATTRACDKRQPEDIDLTAFTHLNFAFAFFDPRTFQMVPMTGGDEDLYRRFTALKSKKPSLKTWIAVGGWSFNDPTNVPNTRTAFSDMVATSQSRQAFITSIIQLLKTYNFDGLDLDWEYPTADDRGGVIADKANFVTFMKELREALGSRYGISITLPASFWYLRGFDVNALQHYLDWMNVMSYDIHGVWDSGNKHTGPYVRPHTNLTEIEEGLDLLWRAGVEPSKVVLGTGWYGRSFTLSNPACNTPNGICTFAEGGKPGECTQSAGTLTNAEINRIIAKGGVVKGYDQKAGVKWITWDSNQWVSYDDGETIQQKVSLANDRCLGGQMIWAVDQDDLAGSSTNDLLGIGPANGVSPERAESAKEQLRNATRAAEIGDSCYWTFCGGSCQAGWFSATQAKGQVAGYPKDVECENNDVQTLCCAPGTSMGTCSWDGWRGVGLSCAPACQDTKAVIVARNSNPSDRDCNGGYQAYCCNGFIPSSQSNTGELTLVGSRGLTRRGKGQDAFTGALACMIATAVLSSILPYLGITLTILGGPAAALGICGGIGAVVGFLVTLLGGSRQNWPPVTPPLDHYAGTPDKYADKKGQWEVLKFGLPLTPAPASSTSCDCHVTYTCRYGNGWDEVCDNQRWAIDKGLGGHTVFHYEKRGGKYSKDDWSNSYRLNEYRTLAVNKIPGVKMRYRCEVDEFPMGAMREGKDPNPQWVRLLNGEANGAQGLDYRSWRVAQWEPCSTYRNKVCGFPAAVAGPPMTWKFDLLDQGRQTARTDGSHFLKAYGFDSQTQGSECYATFYYTANKPIGGPLLLTSTVTDHGFRVMPDDPLFTSYDHDANDYYTTPEKPYPTDVASAKWEKRKLAKAVLLGDEPEFKLHAEDHLKNGGCEDYEVIVENEGHLWCVNPEHLEDYEAPCTQMTVTSTVHVHPTSTMMAYAKASPVSGPVQTAAADSTGTTSKYL